MNLKTRRKWGKKVLNHKQTNKFVDDAKNLAFGAILGGTEKCHPLLPLTADDDVFQDVDADLGDDGDNDEDDDGDKIYLESVLLGELSLATAAAAACLVITSLVYDGDGGGDRHRGRDRDRDCVLIAALMFNLDTSPSSHSLPLPRSQLCSSWIHDSSMFNKNQIH